MFRSFSGEWAIKILGTVFIFSEYFNIFVITDGIIFGWEGSHEHQNCSWGRGMKNVEVHKGGQQICLHSR